MKQDGSPTGNSKTGPCHSFEQTLNKWLAPYEEINKQDRSAIYEELEADVITVEKCKEDHNDQG